MLSQLGFGLVLFLSLGDVAAGDTQYVRLDDGRVQAIYANGTVVEIHPSGAKKTIHPNGERVEVTANGIRTDVSPNGSKTTYLPDGRRVHQHIDGVSTIIHPDGRKDIIQDGRKVTFDPEGQPVAVGLLTIPTTDSERRMMRHDGSEMVMSNTGIYILHPDKKRKWSILYNGDRTLFFSDGRKIVEQGESRTLYDANGVSHPVTVLPDDYWPLPKEDFPSPVRPTEAGTSQPISR